VARLFFAVWPGERCARELAAVGESLASLCGGKPVPAPKIHITLAFLGSVDDARADEAKSVASSLAGSPIAMTMDCVGSFRKARVGWVAASRKPAALGQLQAALAAKLRAVGFELEERAFNPHATLVRKLEKPVPPAPVEPVAWRSDALTLVRSEGDGRYSVVESWKLG
jgi:2'-5' RNA ligase